MRINKQFKKQVPNHCFCYAVFQYSSSNSVNEVTEESFKGCNMTDTLQTSSNGNTSIPLNRPGEKIGRAHV